MTRSRAGLRSLLQQFTKRRFHQFHPPSDMYLRVDKVDAVLEQLKAMQDAIQTCVDEIRHLSSAALPEHQSTVGRRIAVCEEKIDRLLEAVNEKSVQTTDFGAATWEERVQQAQDRKSKLLSFGPNACGLLVKTKHGLFTVDPEDSGVSGSILREGCYAESEYLLAKSLVSKEGDVLIVGAHIGALAVPLSKDCNKLVAIEANPHTYEYLMANLALNRCSNVASYNIAANDKPEKIEFLLNTENSGGSKRKPVTSQTYYVYDDPQVIEVKAMPLDILLEESKYDLILMDIEGSEYFALKGMQRILEESKALSVEFLPHHLAFVSGVQIPDFVGTIMPHFNWMYVPNQDRVVPKNEIVEKMTEMYEAGEGHAGIYFMKEISPKWLEVARELPAQGEAIIASDSPARVEAHTGKGAAPRGVSADDVIASIEMILGRTPDEALVDYHLKLGFPDRFALGKYMLSTDEFRVQLFGGPWRHLFHSFATAGSFEVQRRVLDVLRLLTPHRAEGFRKARFGSPNDGGYILIDDLDRVDAALSFGVEQNASWDVTVADRGVQVYQFDHTIDAPPVSRHDLIFEKKRIVPQAAPGCETLNELVERHGKAGVPSLILKIDIEHDEWSVFDATTESALSCFAQIVGEFHGFGSMIDPPWNERARRVFEKITRQFGVVHVHANNYCGFNSVANVSIPEVLEITFANRSRYKLVPSDEVFPGALDAPNNPYVVDLHLGKFVY